MGKCAALGHSHALQSRLECSPRPQLHAGPEGPAAHTDSLFEAQADPVREPSPRPGGDDHGCPMRPAKSTSIACHFTLWQRAWQGLDVIHLGTPSMSTGP